MGASRCSICAENWPGPFDECPICGEDTTYFDDLKPNPRWRDLIDENSPISPEEVRIIVPKGYEYLGWLFVPHDDLIRAGYKYLETFSVIEIRGQYYELMGYIDEVNCWWVEPCRVPSADHLPETFPDEWASISTSSS